MRYVKTQKLKEKQREEDEKKLFGDDDNETATAAAADDDATKDAIVQLPQKKRAENPIETIRQSAKNDAADETMEEEVIEDTLWEWNDASQVVFHKVQRIHVNDVNAGMLVKEARVNGTPVVLVGHVGWADFAKRWISKRGDVGVDVGEKIKKSVGNEAKEVTVVDAGGDGAGEKEVIIIDSDMENDAKMVVGNDNSKGCEGSNLDETLKVAENTAVAIDVNGEKMNEGTKNLGEMETTSERNESADAALNGVAQNDMAVDGDIERTQDDDMAIDTEDLIDRALEGAVIPIANKTNGQDSGHANLVELASNGDSPNPAEPGLSNTSSDTIKHSTSATADKGSNQGDDKQIYNTTLPQCKTRRLPLNGNTASPFASPTTATGADKEVSGAMMSTSPNSVVGSEMNGTSIVDKVNHDTAKITYPIESEGNKGAVEGTSAAESIGCESKHESSVVYERDNGIVKSTSADLSEENNGIAQIISSVESEKESEKNVSIAQITSSVESDVGIVAKITPSTTTYATTNNASDKNETIAKNEEPSILNRSNNFDDAPLDLSRNDFYLDIKKMIGDIGEEDVPVIKRHYNEEKPIHGNVHASKFLTNCWPNSEADENVEVVKNQKASSNLYLHQWQFPLSDTAGRTLCHQNKALPKSIMGEDLLKYWLDLAQCKFDSPLQYIFMGREDTLSKLHKDPGGLDISIAPIVGEKECVLVHRADGSNCLYHLQASLNDIDLHQYPLLSQAKIWQTTIKPGEILLMPHGTYHQCRNITPCLSYSRFHLDTVNLLPFVESLVNNDAPEIDHEEILWNLTTELISKVDTAFDHTQSLVKHKSISSEDNISEDVVETVNILRALRHFVREVARRHEIQRALKAEESKSDHDFGTLVDDVDMVSLFPAYFN